MNKKQLYNAMKEIIGCPEVTHEALEAYIYSGGWWAREMLPWEHCAMRFQKIYGTMRKEYTAYDIYKCIYCDKSYYFGLGLEEPPVTDDMLENGVWFVYTWSN